MRPTDLHPSDHYCVFRVDQNTFALAATDVREIVEMVPVVAVPRSAPCLAGLCHLRNEFVPVLSLPSMLGTPCVDRNKTEYLLVVDGPEGIWSLAISQAIGLERLEMASTGATHADSHSRVVVGTASFRDRVVRILDSGRLYRMAVEVLEHAWSPQAVSNEPSRGVSPPLSGQTAS